MKRKNFKQRLISFILVFVMIMGLLPLSVINIMADDNIIIGADFENIEMPKAQANGFIAPIDNTVPDNAIHIKTAEQLASIGGAYSEGKYYVLDNDITLVDEWVPIDDFRGTFDGQGHSINNLYVLKESKREYAGLFGKIDYYSNGVIIKNVGVNIGSQGIMSYYSSFTGGVVGYNNNNNTTIENCYVIGNITVSLYADSYIGGLVGHSENTTIKNCYAMVNITPAYFYDSPIYFYSSYAGGLVGHSENTTIENCYATGNIAVSSYYYDSYVGGLIGRSFRTTIKNCYSTGNATAAYYSPSSYAGGLIGYSYGNTVINCYRLSSQTITGDNINQIGTPLTLEQMKDKSSFVGFDFDTVWAIDPNINNGYPYLRANPPKSDNSEPSEYTTVVFDETAYTCEVGTSRISWLMIAKFVSQTMELTEKNLKVSCSDPDAVDIELSIIQGFLDNKKGEIHLNIIPKKVGVFTITLSTIDGAKTEATLTITDNYNIEIAQYPVIRLDGNEYEFSIAISNNDKINSIENITAILSIPDTFSFSYGDSAKQINKLEAGEEYYEVVWKIKSNSYFSKPNFHNFSINIFVGGNQLISQEYKNRLIDGQDTWNFGNYTNGVFTNGYDIEKELYDYLKSVTKPSEFKRMEKSKNRNWNGSCYGMLVTSALFFNKNLDVSYWGNLSNSNWEDTDKNVGSLNNEYKYNLSLINYYHLLQFSDVYVNNTNGFLKSTDINARLFTIESLMQVATLKNELVLVSFNWADHFYLPFTDDDGKKYGLPTSGGHIVMLYGGIEQGNWNYNKRDYQQRIKIYDSSNPFTDTYFYYTHENGGDFVIDNWNIHSETYLQYKNEILSTLKITSIVSSSDIDILDPYNPQKANLKLKNIQANNNLQNNLLNSYGNTKLIINADNGKSANIDSLLINGNLEVYPFFSNSALDKTAITNDISVLISDVDNTYIISNQEDNSKMDLSMSYLNNLSSGICSNGNSMTFSPNGTISIDMNNSDYTLMQVHDNGYSNIPWHTIIISGENANNISLERIGDDILFSSDNMQNIVVTGENDVETVILNFSTYGENVLIKAEDNILVAYIDTNDDGIFDTLVTNSKNDNKTNENNNNGEHNNSNDNYYVYDNSQVNQEKIDDIDEIDVDDTILDTLISELTEEQKNILNMALKNIGLISINDGIYVTVPTKIDKNKTPLYVKADVSYNDKFNPTQISYYRLNSDGTFTPVPTIYNSETNKIVIYANESGIYVPIINEFSFTDVKSEDWFYEYVNEAVKLGIVNGRSKEIFDPLTANSYADTVAMLFRAIGISPNQKNNNDWSKPYIDKAILLGIYDKEWKANDIITREKMVIIMANSLKILGICNELTDIEIEEILKDFIDKDKISIEAREAMAICIKERLVVGVDKEIPTLDPQGKFTRAQMATIAVRFRQLFIDKIEI